MNKCNNCGKETTNPKYCSRSCSAVVNNKLSKKRKRTKECKVCGTPILANYTYCTSCYKNKITSNDISLGDAIYTRHHRSSAYALVRSRARSIMKSEPQVCRSCGYDKHVEVCHIKPIKDFNHDTMLSVINSVSNLVLLCPNCHWEFDNGLLKL